MKKEIKMTAKRGVVVKEVFAMLDLWKYEKRPDMAILLQKLDEGKRYGLSDGEQNNLKKYFQSLGLISSSNRLTKSGRELISKRIMKTPERGIYKIYYITDIIIGKMVLDYREVDARDTEEYLEIKGKIIPFEDFEGIEGREFEKLFSEKKEKFSLEFVKSDSGIPSVALGDESEHKLVLKLKGVAGNNSVYKCEWKTEISVGKNRGELKGQVEMDIAENISSWFNAFSKDNMAIEMDFETAKKKRTALGNFKTNETLTATISFENKKDDNVWEISLEIPVVPKTESDANEWIEYLLRREMTDNEYIQKAHIEKKYINILENSTIPDAFPKWFFSIDGFIKRLEEMDNKLYYHIKATEDLYVDYFMATMPQDEWKKKIIVVDGSNVAWNKKDKKKGGHPVAKNIEIIIEHLKKKGFEKIIVFCDANLKYLVEDKDVYEELIQSNKLTPVPSHTIADYFLIDYAQRYGAYIVTGDKYRDWKRDAKKFGWDKSDIETKDFKITGEEAIVYNLEVKT